MVGEDGRKKDEVRWNMGIGMGKVKFFNEIDIRCVTNSS